MITGAGVSELIDRIVSTDLADLEPCLQRHHILLGTRTYTNTETLPQILWRERLTHRHVGRRKD